MDRKLLLAAVSAIMIGGQAHAGFGVDGSVGTPGISLNGHYQVSPFVTLRAGVNAFEWEFSDVEFDGISYDSDLNFTNVGGYVDFHPMMNGLTLTGGVVFGDRTVDFSSTPTADVQVGDLIFTPEEVGSILGSADFGSNGLYAGVGWDSTTHGLLPVALVLRLGILATESPEISLISVGGLADTDPTVRDLLDAELATEAANAQEDLENFRFYPMISFGIGFGF